VLAAGQGDGVLCPWPGIDWGSRENITVGEKPVKSGPGALFLDTFFCDFIAVSQV
jgi:hypothetical protein